VSVGWDDLSDGLPVHADEVMSARPGQPSIAEQDVNNGAGIPPVDRGPDCG
jgi:hypothetical protein